MKKPKRSYRKSDEVYADLVRRCETCGPGDSRLLPTERELAVELQTSRMTLRNALEMAEMRGLIHRENKRREIVMPQFTLQECGQILFIATGHHQIHLGAFQRLWFNLKPQLERFGASLKLLLTNEHTSKAEIQTCCDKADVILLSSITHDKPPVNADFLQQMQSRKKIISLSDPHLETFDNYIALNNYAVGELAAATLLQAGCRCPAFIVNHLNSLMFHKRWRGFSDKMREAGIPVPADFPSPDSRHSLEVRRQELKKAVDSGCDGAFLVSDEGVDFITHDLFVENLIPDKFKLITLNGSGEALLCSPPITCVSHATEGVSRAVVKHLKAYSRNPDVHPIRQLVKPNLYLNHTIGDMELPTEGKINYETALAV